jgi:hypothetical protein
MVLPYGFYSLTYAMRVMTIPNQLCTDELLDACDRVANMYGDGQVFNLQAADEQVGNVIDNYAVWISEHDEEPYLPQVLINHTLLLSNWDAINEELLGIIDQTADLRSGSDKGQLTKLYKKIKGLLYDL